MRPSCSLLCSLLVSGLIPASAVADTAWPRVAPRDFTFAALMPVPPTVEGTHTSSFIGETHSTTYFSNTGDNRFSVSVTALPRTASWLAPQRVLFARVKARILEEVHGTEESFDDTERDGVAGRLLRFDSRPPDEAPRRGRAEMFYVGDKLLVAMGSHSRDATADVMERFFAGLRLDLQRCRDTAAADAEDSCRVDLALDD